MRMIETMVIHCADTPDDSPHSFTVADIDSWHKQRGFHRDEGARAVFNPELAAIGYHYVIYRDGTLHTGRAENEVGAHVEGHNAHSLGICLVGQSRFTPAQWNALKALLAQLLLDHPGAGIHGHYEFDTAIAQGKTCPNFEAPAYLARACSPDERNIYLA